jgi:hypothetical protein
MPSWPEILVLLPFFPVFSYSYPKLLTLINVVGTAGMVIGQETAGMVIGQETPLTLGLATPHTGLSCKGIRALAVKSLYVAYSKLI